MNGVTTQTGGRIATPIAAPSSCRQELAANSPSPMDCQSANNAGQVRTQAAIQIAGSALSMQPRNFLWRQIALGRIDAWANASGSLNQSPALLSLLEASVLECRPFVDQPHCPPDENASLPLCDVRPRFRRPI